MSDDGERPAGEGVPEQVLAQEACVPIAALRIEDPELRRSAGDAVPVPADGHHGPLPDDVAAEVDPRPPGELQPKAGGIRDGAGQASLQAGWLDDHEERSGPPSQC